MTQKKQTKQAISHFAKALHINPSFIDGHTNMGVILNNLGRKEEAFYHLHEAAKLSPENQHLQRLLQMASPKKIYS